MKIHELKSWPAPFEAIDTGSKRHEFRRDDRGFEQGDLLLLREWLPEAREYKGHYTGREQLLEVTRIEYEPLWGIPEGYVILTVRPVSVVPA